MAYIPKHKQVVGGKVDGTIMKDGQPYNGPYTVDYQGNVYEGAGISNTRNATQLEVVREQAPERPFESYVRVPTEEDYEAGFFRRYFIQDRRSNKVIEVDKALYDQQNRFRVPYRTTHTLDWIIIGPIEDIGSNVVLGNYQTLERAPGTRSKNQALTRTAEKIMPGITLQILPNPLQFVRN